MGKEPASQALPRDKRGRILWKNVPGFLEWVKTLPKKTNLEVAEEMKARWGTLVTDPQVASIRRSYGATITSADARARSYQQRDFQKTLAAPPATPTEKLELSDLTKKIRSLESRNTLYEVIGDKVIRAVQNLPEIKFSPPLPVPKGKKLEEEEMVLLISDVQAGLKVDAKESGGLGAFGIEVLLKEIDYLQAAVSSVHRYHPNVRKLNVFWLGDIVEGEGHPVGTNILTPNGWRPIETLRVGDEVMGAAGKPTGVIGVYPRGQIPVFRVTFTDGSSILTDAEHRWAVRSVKDQVHGKPFVVKQTAWLADHLTVGSEQLNWRIPQVEPLEFRRRVDAFKIEPYFLGLLLGDGSFRSYTPTISIKDPRVLEEAKRAALPLTLRSVALKPGRCPQFTVGAAERQAGGQHTENPITEELRRLGLWGCSAWDKFIPDQYLFAPAPDRLALLQGLLDSDGEIRGSLKRYSTTSERLASGVEFLVHSLGGTTRRQTRVKVREGKKYRPCFTISLTLPKDVVPTRAKVNDWIPPVWEPRRIIKSITPEGSAEVICLAVDAPDECYVTEHCIVTHNTIFGGQLREIQFGVIQQVLFCWERFSRFLADFAGEFSEIHCRGVVGNHGRIGRVGEHSPMSNFDYLLYKMMEERLRPVRNISWKVSESWWDIAEVQGWKFLLVHGDDSGYGWAGIPFYGVSRHKTRYRELFKSLAQQYGDFDYMVCGHHSQAASFNQIHMNGSWPGGTEFSLKRLQLGDVPTQALLGVHRTHGLTWRRDIHLRPLKTE